MRSGIYSEQTCFCNCCGKKMEVPLPTVYGARWKVCGEECHREIEWRETLSIMGKPYRPREDKPERSS